MQYTPNFSLEMPDASDPFGDFRQSYNDNLVIIDNNLGGGGGSSSLAGLSDVNLVTPTDGQILTYDGNSSKWVNANGGGGGGGAVYMGAELLWEGSFSGAGTIDVPNLDQYLVIAVQNDVSVLVLGNAFTGSGALGLYNQASSYSYAYRFNNSVTNKLTIDQNNRGIMYNGNTTYAGSSWCTITKIYGLVKKSGADGRGGTTYTTTEQVVGTWLGKPLYQITIPFSGINTYANTWYALNISSYLNNPEIVFNISDMDYYFVSGVQRMFSNTSYEPPNMLLQTNVNRTNISGHVTVRYTKTTDT